ncbi:hypothetical protein [Streptomyces gardneri]|uniref:hypothetical protein n=1 Tax=Streptomyces gardneri TaxID=66892 RepID=UPI0033F121E6
MSAVYGAILCDRCGEPIKGEVKKVPVFSASGARPDMQVHANALACAPRRRR